MCPAEEKIPLLFAVFEIIFVIQIKCVNFTQCCRAARSHIITVEHESELEKHLDIAMTLMALTPTMMSNMDRF
jgi:hypothetical protein